MKSTLYYYPGTPPSGSADPLRRATQMRSVLRTGWGPRGDSGSARGRVRATQPAFFKYLIPQSLRTGQNRKGPLLLASFFHFLRMLPSKCSPPAFPPLLIYLSSLTNFTMHRVSLVTHALPATLKS